MILRLWPSCGRPKSCSPQAQIQQRVAELAVEIRRTIPDDLHIIAVLKGAFMFLSDLARHMPGHVSLDFMAVSSYAKGTTSLRRSAAAEGSRHRARRAARRHRRRHRRHRADAHLSAGHPPQRAARSRCGPRASSASRRAARSTSRSSTSASPSRTGSSSATASTTPSSIATCRTSRCSVSSQISARSALSSSTCTAVSRTS